ncbi:hypothetical protein [Phytopseudomonas daroniae]|uniref:hypothetical protein n=1 Tax=Phytopseudomonas daroniae TaxID=2487519 RepID=UPI0010385438|nr:hypothetical protein [Pseudomonas daroniae]TBU78188.1 hypothetical protein DNK10_00110 [Pseudomonas daroniae]
MTDTTTVDPLANCRALAAKPAFSLFALNLRFLEEDGQHLELVTASAARLQGMADAYNEMFLLPNSQTRAIIDELSAYVRELQA